MFEFTLPEPAKLTPRRVEMHAAHTRFEHFDMCEVGVVRVVWSWYSGTFKTHARYHISDEARFEAFCKERGFKVIGGPTTGRGEDPWARLGL